MRRAHPRGALFALGLCWLILVPAWAEPCLDFRADEWVVPAHVHDGDTLRLADGRKLRLLGINTPEIGYDGEASEPLAEEARKALRTLVGQVPRLALRYDRERKDRYGRLLAHVFLPDRRNLQVLLLHQGLAAAVAVAPNLANVECYLAAERQAAGRGIWRLPAYQGIETTALSRQASGFHIIQGRVQRVGESRHAVWLNLSGNVAVRLDKRDLPRFGAGFDARRLQGKTLKLRGWLYRVRGEARMNLDHPAAMLTLE